MGAKHGSGGAATCKRVHRSAAGESGSEFGGPCCGPLEKNRAASSGRFAGLLRAQLMGKCPDAQGLRWMHSTHGDAAGDEQRDAEGARQKLAVLRCRAVELRPWASRRMSHLDSSFMHAALRACLGSGHV